MPANCPVIDFMRKILSIVLPLIVVASAQSPPRFDVASIKELPPDTPLPTGISVRITATSITATANLGTLIRRAHAPLQRTRIIGVPAWATSILYELRAKTEIQSSQEEMKRMLRTLLSDRFGLKIHSEPREIDYLALVAIAGQSRLKPMNPDMEEPTPVNGVFHLRNLQAVADMLGSWMSTTVIDETHLAGDYDITLDLRHEDYRETGGHSPRGTDLLRAIGQAMARHIQQFGLKLEKRRGPLEILVIDQVLRPSEN